MLEETRRFDRVCDGCMERRCYEGVVDDMSSCEWKDGGGCDRVQHR